MPAFNDAVSFETLFNAAEEIPFNPNWSNSTGYLDYAVLGDDAPALAKGQMAKAVQTYVGHDADKMFRRILIVGCGNYRNYVVFDRYSPAEQHYVQVVNADYAFCRKHGIQSSGAVTEEVIQQLLGVVQN